LGLVQVSAGVNGINNVGFSKGDIEPPAVSEKTRLSSLFRRTAFVKEFPSPHCRLLPKMALIIAASISGLGVHL